MIKKNFFFVKMFGRKKKIKIVKINQQHVLKNIWRGMGKRGLLVRGQQHVYGVKNFVQKKIMTTDTHKDYFCPGTRI